MIRRLTEVHETNARPTTWESFISVIISDVIIVLLLQTLAWPTNPCGALVFSSNSERATVLGLDLLFVSMNAGSEKCSKKGLP